MSITTGIIVAMTSIVMILILYIRIESREIQELKKKERQCRITKIKNKRECKKKMFEKKQKQKFNIRRKEEIKNEINTTSGIHTILI